MSNILPQDSSKVSYTQNLFVSKKFDNFDKITLRVTETGPSRIQMIGTPWSTCVRIALHNKETRGVEMQPLSFNSQNRKLKSYML